MMFSPECCESHTNWNLVVHTSCHINRIRYAVSRSGTCFHSVLHMEIIALVRFDYFIMIYSPLSAKLSCGKPFSVVNVVRG